MRKILITLLTISVIVISLSVTAFASTSSIYLTEPVISENVATTYLVLNPVDTGLAGITIDYTVTGGTAVVTDTEALKALDSTMTMEAGTNITFMTGDAGIASLGDATQIVKFEITRDGEATSTTVDLSVSEAYDSNMDELAVTETDLTFNWVAAPTMYNVTINADGGEGTAVPTTGEYEEGAEITLPALTKDGYNFLGWNDGSQTIAGGTTVTVTADITYTAVFELIPAPPVEVTATQVNGPSEELTIGENKYTGLYVFNGTTDKASFKLKAVYDGGENYLKFNGNTEIAVSGLVVEGSGTVTFKAAVIGVPANITITKLVIE